MSMNDEDKIKKLLGDLPKAPPMSDFETKKFENIYTKYDIYLIKFPYNLPLSNHFVTNIYFIARSENNSIKIFKVFYFIMFF